MYLRLGVNRVIWANYLFLGQIVMFREIFFHAPVQRLSVRLRVLQILYNLPLSAASAAALNDHRRFLFLYSFKTKCVNMAVIHVLYALNLKLWLRSNPVKSFLLRNEATDTVSQQ